MTSSLLVADLKGKVFGCTIHPPSVIVLDFMVAELKEGANVSPQKMKKSSVYLGLSKVVLRS